MYFFRVDLSVFHIFTSFIGKKRILHFNLHFHNSFRFMVFIFSLIYRDAINVSIRFLVLKWIYVELPVKQNSRKHFVLFPVNTWRPKPKLLLRRWENKLLQLIHTFLSWVVLLLCNNKKLPCDFSPFWNWISKSADAITLRYLYLLYKIRALAPHRYLYLLWDFQSQNSCTTIIIRRAPFLILKLIIEWGHSIFFIYLKGCVSFCNMICVFLCLV